MVSEPCEEAPTNRSCYCFIPVSNSNTKLYTSGLLLLGMGEVKLCLCLVVLYYLMGPSIPTLHTFSPLWLRDRLTWSVESLSQNVSDYPRICGDRVECDRVFRRSRFGGRCRLILVFSNIIYYWAYWISGVVNFHFFRFITRSIWFMLCVKW